MYLTGSCLQCTPLWIHVEVVGLVGVALFFLLAYAFLSIFHLPIPRLHSLTRPPSFRVHDAYSRFERGLTVWREAISCTVCNFATLSGRIFPEGLLHEGDRKRLFSFLIAFPVTLKRRLRGERDIGELASVLAQADIEKLQVANNMPRYCLEVLNTYVMEAAKHQDLFPQIFIDRLLGKLRILSMSMNQCERIREYSVNYGYLAHLRLFIALWLILLPFSLVQDCGWTTVVVCPFVAYGILAFEQLAAELSEPFVRCEVELRG